MTTAKNCAILLLVTALVLLWSFQIRGEMIKLRAEGRIHKIDATESTDPAIEVGATFLFEFSYDTDAKGTIMVSGLTIGSVERLLKQGVFFGKVNHSSKVGAWDRLRLTIEKGKESILGGSGTPAAFLNVKVAFDSRTDPHTTYQHYLPINGPVISLGSETFFHLIYSDVDAKRGPDGLISGEITSITKVDD